MRKLSGQVTEDQLIKAFWKSKTGKKLKREAATAEKNRVRSGEPNSKSQTPRTTVETLNHVKGDGRHSFEYMDSYVQNQIKEAKTKDQGFSYHVIADPVTSVHTYYLPQSAFNSKQWKDVPKVYDQGGKVYGVKTTFPPGFTHDDFNRVYLQGASLAPALGQKTVEFTYKGITVRMAKREYWGERVVDADFGGATLSDRSKADLINEALERNNNISKSGDQYIRTGDQDGYSYTIITADEKFVMPVTFYPIAAPLPEGWSKDRP
jgi:hypothetical protein